ncbi:MAG: lipopolysaccharide biosynthesis protein [Burkholderiales bacterium]
MTAVVTAPSSNAHAYYSLRRFRRALAWFLSGKAMAALLALATFALVVRLAPVEEYGAYVTLLAAAELGIALAAFGVDWIALRYIPECRSTGDHRALARFSAGLLIVHCFTLAVGACAGYFLLVLVGPHIDIAPWRGLFGLWMVILVVEGVARFARDILLGSLLLQGYAQGALVLRNIVQIAMLGILAGTGTVVDARMLTCVELITAIASALAGIGFLAAALARPRDEPVNAAHWSLPPRNRLAKVAFHNYTTAILNQAFAPSVLTIVCGAFFGASGAAMLGFGLRVTDLVNKYLPVNFLVHVLRPMMIARYVDGASFSRLNQQAMLAYKASMVVLLPAIVLVALHGPLLIGLVTGNKYEEAAPVLLVLLAYLIARNHLALLGIVLNAVERMALATRALLISLLLLPIVLLLARSGLGPLGLVLGVLIESLVSNALIVAGLRRAGYPYVLQRGALGRIALAGMVAYLPIAALATGPVSPTLALLQCAIALLILGGALLLLRPFTHEERQAMRRVVPDFSRGA